MTAGPPDLEERPVPLWQKVAAAAYTVTAAALLAVFRQRLHADFWPPDASRIAPNIVAEIVALLAATPVAVLLWPPARRRLHRFVTSHTAPLHDRLELLHEQRERHHSEALAAHAETQRYLAHVIEHHPSIPPLPHLPHGRPPKP